MFLALKFHFASSGPIIKVRQGFSQVAKKNCVLLKFDNLRGIFTVILYFFSSFFEENDEKAFSQIEVFLLYCGVFKRVPHQTS